MGEFGVGGEVLYSSIDDDGMIFQLWVDGMNKPWFLMEMMIFYFQYFNLVFALEAPHCSFLSPGVACNLNLIRQG